MATLMVDRKWRVQAGIRDERTVPSALLPTTRPRLWVSITSNFGFVSDMLHFLPIPALSQVEHGPASSLRRQVGIEKHHRKPLNFVLWT